MVRSDRPWCFAVRSDQLLVFCSKIQQALVFCDGFQLVLLFSSEILLALVFFGKIRPPVAVSDKFSIGVEVLTNFLVIFMDLWIVCSKLFQLEGEC